jgi:hypothetical protein
MVHLSSAPQRISSVFLVFRDGMKDQILIEAKKKQGYLWYNYLLRSSFFSAYLGL